MLLGPGKQEGKAIKKVYLRERRMQRVDEKYEKKMKVKKTCAQRTRLLFDGPAG